MIEYLLFVLGLFLLLKGADYLVDGSSALAKKLGIPTLVIGLTIVAFGTSMPEFVVNIIASFKGNGDIAFGNIIGSNIANILLILGVSATIMSLKVQQSTIWKEIPFSLLAAVVVILFAGVSYLDPIAGGTLWRFEGFILILFFVIFLYYVLELVRKNKKQPTSAKLEITKLSSTKITLMIVGGLIALFLGGRWVVSGAVELAKFFGISEYLISLTIVALGTSLPELITSVVATLKKDPDIAVGNIVGSNIFNIFWILGISAVISPVKFPAFALADLFILMGVTFLLFLFMFVIKKHELERWQGVLFIILYVIYIYYLIRRG